MATRIGGGKLIKKVFGGVDLKTAKVSIPEEEISTDSEELFYDDSEDIALLEMMKDPFEFMPSHSKKRRGKHANLRKFSAPTGGRFP